MINAILDMTLQLNYIFIKLHLPEHIYTQARDALPGFSWCPHILYTHFIISQKTSKGMSLGM